MTQRATNRAGTLVAAPTSRNRGTVPKMHLFVAAPETMWIILKFALGLVMVAVPSVSSDQMLLDS